MWSSWAESAKSSVTNALEKTGDVISKVATNAGKPSRETSTSDSVDAAALVDDSPAGPAPGRYYEPTMAVMPPQKNELLTSLSQGWSSVVETTRASMKQAEAKVKEQQVLMQERLSKARSTTYKRDPSLPLDVEALKDAEVVYVTDRLITCGHPAMASQIDGDISGERKLAAIGHLLNRRHGGRFMVWNLSEVDYDVDVLDDQVLAFTFAGSPSPPLGLLLKLLVSMESWLKADDRNVAVVHCLTGKGRTSSVLAAFLCWMGQAQFSDIFDALAYIAACKQIPVDELTIPSQRRYASYFKNMLDGVRPSQPPLMLKRVIMSEAPRFAKGPPRQPLNGEDPDKVITDESQLMGCVPYLQIFKAGKLLHTAPASLHFQQADNELPFCQVADGSVSFHVNLVIQGDILVRARHLTHNKKRVSMFRAAFHTGYTPPNVMRFTKAQLDGACSDDRFVQEFFLDFIFEPADAEEASRLLSVGVSDEEGKDITEASPVAIDRKKRANAVEASADDTMLHRESRFWEVIATRVKENAAGTDGKEDPMWGPTVGRRRDFSEKGDEGESDTKNVASEQTRNALESFSIGGEYDFLPEVEDPKSSQRPGQVEPISKAAPKKDSLMEALMGALDDDEHGDDMEQDVIEFESDVPYDRSDQVDHAVTPAVETSHAATADSTDTEEATDQNQEFAVNVAPASSDDDIQALLADANLNLDDDMDALMATDGDGVSDDDLLNFDVDDAELKDLESFLSPAK